MLCFVNNYCYSRVLSYLVWWISKNSLMVADMLSTWLARVWKYSEGGGNLSKGLTGWLLQDNMITNPKLILKICRENHLKLLNMTVLVQGWLTNMIILVYSVIFFVSLFYSDLILEWVIPYVDHKADAFKIYFKVFTWIISLLLHMKLNFVNTSSKVENWLKLLG